MPVISRFLGINIVMYYRDHEPPHFHAMYNDFEAIFAIDDLRLMEGKLPGRVAGFVVEWAMLHREELLKDWELCRQHQPLNKINPLM